MKKTHSKRLLSLLLTAALVLSLAPVFTVPALAAYENSGVTVEDTQPEDYVSGTTKGNIGGYEVTFAGWYEDDNYSGNAVTSPEAGGTYYAKWTYDGKTVYTGGIKIKDGVVTDASGTERTEGPGWKYYAEETDDYKAHTLVLDNVAFIGDKSALVIDDHGRGCYIITKSDSYILAYTSGADESCGALTVIDGGTRIYGPGKLSVEKRAYNNTNDCDIVAIYINGNGFSINDRASVEAITPQNKHTDGSQYIAVVNRNPEYYSTIYVSNGGLLAARGADKAIDAKLGTNIGVITSESYDGSNPTTEDVFTYSDGILPAEGTRYLKTADSNFITFGVTVEDTQPEEYISGKTKGKICGYELKFAGWYEDDSYSGDAVTTFSDNRFYYAKWMYGTQTAYNKKIYIKEDGSYYYNEFDKYVPISEGAGWKYYQEASGDYEAHTLVLNGAFILGLERAIIIQSDCTVITENDSIVISCASPYSDENCSVGASSGHIDYEGPGVLRAITDDSAAILPTFDVAFSAAADSVTIKSGAAVIATAPDTESSSSSYSIGASGKITVEDGAVLIAQGASYGYFGLLGKLTTSGEELIYYSEYYDGSGSESVPASDYADGADFVYENKYFRINSPAELNDYGVTVTGVNPKKYVSGTTKGYAGDCELTFAGWYEDIDYTGDAAASVENGKTYYAKWMHGTIAAYPNGLYISNGMVYDGVSNQPCNEGPGWKFYPEATDDYDARTLVLDGAALLSLKDSAIAFMDTTEPLSPYTIVTKSDSYIYGGKDSEYKFVSFGGTVNFEGPGTLTIEGDAISRYKFCAPIYTDSCALTVKDGASVIVKTPAEEVDEEYDYVAIYMENAALTVEDGGKLIAQGADIAVYATLVTPCAVIVSNNYDGSDAGLLERGYFESGDYDDGCYLSIGYPFFLCGGVTVEDTQPEDYVSGETKGNIGGYEVTFAGWYEDDNYSGNAVTSPEAGTTYYAKWTYDGKTVYTNWLEFSYNSESSEGPGWKYLEEATADYPAHSLVIDGAVFLGEGINFKSEGYYDNSFFNIVVESDCIISTVANSSENANSSLEADNSDINIYGPGTLTIEVHSCDTDDTCEVRTINYWYNGDLTVKSGASVIVKTPAEKNNEDSDFIAINFDTNEDHHTLTVEEGGSLLAQSADCAVCGALVTPCAVVTSENYDGSDATTEEAGTYASGKFPSMGIKYLEINGKPKFVDYGVTVDGIEPEDYNPKMMPGYIAGYEVNFGGWYEDEAFSGERAETFESGKTYYAKWSYGNQPMIYTGGLSIKNGVATDAAGNERSEGPGWKYYAEETDDYGARTLVLENAAFIGEKSAITIEDDDHYAYSIVTKGESRICAYTFGTDDSCGAITAVDCDLYFYGPAVLEVTKKAYDNNNDCAIVAIYGEGSDILINNGALVNAYTNSNKHTDRSEYYGIAIVPSAPYGDLVVADGAELKAQAADRAVAAKLITPNDVITSESYNGENPSTDSSGYKNGKTPPAGVRYLVTGSAVFKSCGVTVKDTLPKNYVSGTTKGTVAGYEVTFGGWYEDNSYSGSAVTDFSNGKTYYAKWMYGTQTACTRTIAIKEDGCYYYDEKDDDEPVPGSEGAGWKYYQEASGDYDAHTLVLNGAFILGGNGAIDIRSDCTVITESDSIVIAYPDSFNNDTGCTAIGIDADVDFEGPGILRALVDDSASITNAEGFVLEIDEGAATIKSGAAVIATAPETPNNSEAVCVGALGDITVEDGGVFIAQGDFAGYWGILTTSCNIFYSTSYDGSGCSVAIGGYEDGQNFEEDNKYFRIGFLPEFNTYGVSVTGAEPEDYVSGTTKGHAGDCELTFAGWYDNIDYTGSPVTKFALNTRYYAKWMLGTTAAYPNGLCIADGESYEYISQQPRSEGPGWKFYGEATADYAANTLVLDGAVILGLEDFALLIETTSTDPAMDYTIVTKSDSYIFATEKIYNTLCAFNSNLIFKGPGTLTIEQVGGIDNALVPLYVCGDTVTIKDGASVIVRTPAVHNLRDALTIAIGILKLEGEDLGTITVEDGGALKAQGADLAVAATLVTPGEVITSESYDGSNPTTEEEGTYASGAMPSRDVKYLEICAKPEFDLGGVTVTGAEPEDFVSGTTRGTKNGVTYVFGGWYEKSDFSGSAVTEFKNGAKYYAKWLSIYTVTFNANGHGTAPSAQTVSYGGKVTEPTAPSVTGYTFGGWYKEAACNNVWSFTSDTVTANTTLYAKWTINSYTVTFNANGHGTAPAQQTISYGGKVTEPTAPSATGYTFGGWYKDAACTQAWNFSSDTVTAAMTLYAKWTSDTVDTFVVTFNMNGHGTAPAQQTVVSGGKVTEPTAPTADGYTFGGWYKDAACTQAWNFSSDTVTAAMTLYAKWTENPVQPTHPFEDVTDPEAYYYDAVLWATSTDPVITDGMTETLFCPEFTCTRAQAVTFLWRAKGCPEPEATECVFTDLEVDSYYYKAVLWAVENGITNGTDYDKFSPEDTVTRAQIVTLIYRMIGEPEVDGTNDFTDIPEDAYYVDSVQWAVLTGVTDGMDIDKFCPDVDCTRGMIVTFLYRHFVLNAESELVPGDNIQ